MSESEREHISLVRSFLIVFADILHMCHHGLSHLHNYMQNDCGYMP